MSPGAKTTPAASRWASFLLAAVAAYVAVYAGARNDMSAPAWALAAAGAAAGAAFSWWTRDRPRRANSAWAVSIIMSVLSVASDVAFGDVPSSRSAILLAILAGTSSAEAVWPARRAIT